MRYPLKRPVLSIGILIIFFQAVSFSQDVERLSLHDAMVIALRNNPQALASARRIDAERGRFWRGISPPSPSVAVSYEYIPAAGGISQFGERSIGITQSIDFPTTILFRGLQLSSQVSVAEAEQAATSIELMTRVKTAYYNVLAKQKKIELARENLVIAEDFAQKAETRHKIGEATNLERLTAAVQRTQARSALEVAQNDLTISLGELYVTLGRTKTEQQNNITLTDSLVYQPITGTLEQLTEMAYSVNPQLKAASGQISVAALGRTLAWSSFLPNLNASYYRQTVIGNPDSYGVSFGLSVPLWFLLDQRGQIQEASANVGIAEHNLQSAANSISVDVKNAFLEMKNNERQIILHRTDILPQAEEAYRSAYASYQAGEISYIEFLQVRQLMSSTRNEYFEELARYCISLAKLEYAVGTSFIQ
ncbi:MAG: TolC family protein [Ignavibacteriae bacterium]|nr:MAG: TolC family protein [Ignavibacteriota bacterium]